MIKFLNVEPGSPLNFFKPLRVIEAQCYHCQRTTIVPLVDVESEEGRYWREKYEHLFASLNSALQDCRMLHGDDPIRIFLDKRLQDIRNKQSTE